MRSLRPEERDVSGGAVEVYLDRYAVQLGQLSRARLAVVDQKLGLRDDGKPLAASTAVRYRNVSRACIRRAVELEVISTNPWPPAPHGRGRRRSTRTRRRVDVRALPDPPTMQRALDAMVTHQPASRMYRTMTAVAYFAGLRPSEVVMLRPSHLELPDAGWGTIHVREADVAFDVPGEPKTGARSVPIPPQLVAILRDWLEVHEVGPADLLFRTRTDRRPSAANWSRSWHRALRQIDHPPLRVYDCRHAAATTWLQAGVPLGEVAMRMGHSVETLVSTYVGALAGDRELANHRIEAFITVDEPRVR